MTTEAVTLELTPREILGKKVKVLRREGILPVHLYGPGVDSRPLQCESPKLIEILARAGGNTPITITIKGEDESHLAFAREIQWDPRRDDILHVDFLVAEVSRPVSAQVPIVLVGDSMAARAAGGTVMQQLRTLSVEALPLEIPGDLEVDLARMTETDSVIRAGDIILASNVIMLTDPEDVVARIEMPRAAVEVEAEEDAAEAQPEAETDGGDAEEQR